MTAGARGIYLRRPDDDGSREAFSLLLHNLCEYNLAHRSPLVPVTVEY